MTDDWKDRARAKKFNMDEPIEPQQDPWWKTAAWALKWVLVLLLFAGIAIFLLVDRFG